MSTTSFLAKLGAMAVAAVAPATLFLGAGTAHAIVTVVTQPSPGGVDVFVTSWPEDPAEKAASGWCLFNSSVVGNPIGKPLPAVNVPFYMPDNPPGAGTQSRLWFPSYPTGSTWNISVECPGSPAQFSQLVW